MEVFLKVHGRRHRLVQALVSGQVNESRKEFKHLCPAPVALPPHCLWHPRPSSAVAARYAGSQDQVSW